MTGRHKITPDPYYSESKERKKISLMNLYDGKTLI